MVVGYVLIQVEPTKEVEVLKKLLEVPEVVEAHTLFGEYDIIAKVVTSTLEEFTRIILNKIRKIDGIVGTKTLMGAMTSSA
ncbi:MAG: Lrp/AsnC ligand binding domain-containing protein [Euryarchaeota archaeon]|nr:Lrp/AsnC ligand binding domain-containing protein [Euryarchaeota archaeon]